MYDADKDPLRQQDISIRQANFDKLSPKTQKSVLHKVDAVSSRFPAIYALYRKVVNLMTSNSERFAAFLKGNKYLGKTLTENLYVPNDYSEQADLFYASNKGELVHHSYMELYPNQSNQHQEGMPEIEQKDDLKAYTEALEQALASITNDPDFDFSQIKDNSYANPN